MKKYALFAGLRYYPVGGIRDLIDFFDTEEAAVKHFIEGQGGLYGWDWGQVVDSTSWKVLQEIEE